MKFHLQKLIFGLGAAFMLASTLKSDAFALLGPVQPWMQPTNGVIGPGDIGGPMDIGSGYRWNVPVVTYGFDKSFLDYFGTNGVAAVESAIQIINDLPPASGAVLTNYPFVSLQVNYAAQTVGLSDLKSQVLSDLLEQLGLAQPARNIFILKQWDTSLLPPYANLFSGEADWPAEAIPEFIVQRNFDPQTLEPTSYINDILYTAYIDIQPGQYEMIPYLVDPLVPDYPAVADNDLYVGEYFTGLTYDDLGGLRYLLSKTNINYEMLLPDVAGVGANAGSFVNGAWRPGVEKITFVPQSTGLLPGTFLPLTNQFTDTYLINGNAIQQQLQRVTTQPDFLFSAGNDFYRTGTTNWINNAAMNNNPTGAGPGIIRPPVTIVLQKTGSFFYSSSSVISNAVVWSEDLVQGDESSFWGSFDGSTNAPIIYPAPQTGNVSMSVRVFLRHSNYGSDFQKFEWLPTSPAGTVYALQTSTNLSTWNTLFTVTNNGSVCTYQNVNANSSTRFYQLVPQ